jgi:hypothetical protein
MQDSLDQPPIVIRSSSKNAALMLVIAIIFVTICVFILRDPAQNRLIAYSGIVLFGLCVPLFAWRLFRPDSLTISTHGIAWRDALRTTHWAWEDVQAIRAFRPSSKNIIKHLGFDFTDSYHAKRGGLLILAKAMTGVEGSLGSGWEMSATDLAELPRHGHGGQARRPELHVRKIPPCADGQIIAISSPRFRPDPRGASRSSRALGVECGGRIGAC